MHRKTLLLTVLAVTTVVVIMAISALTVFALVGGLPAQGEKVTVDETFELAPVQAEPVSHQEVVKPVLQHERAGYEGKTGCSYSAKLQMTEAPAETVQEQPLARVGQ